jgi:hypothetical protein
MVMTATTISNDNANNAKQKLYCKILTKLIREKWRDTMDPQTERLVFLVKLNLSARALFS